MLSYGRGDRGPLSQSTVLYSSHFEGRKAGQLACTAADEARTGNQSQDREGARPDRTTVDARIAPTR